MVGYGAAHKGNTFLNSVGKSAKILKYVVDASHEKQGKFLPGSQLPVLSPNNLNSCNPTDVLILPWNISDEISKLVRELAPTARIWVAQPKIKQLYGSKHKMKLEPTPIQDLFLLQRAIRSDARGTFTRLFGADEIAAAGRPTKAIHVNTSTSSEGNTLRGIHFQYPPFAEAKVVACTAGAIWDVAIDLRPGSITRYQWYGAELTPENGLSMIVPEGFGHAFITLMPDTTAVYVVSEIYSPNDESGLRYDDPSLSIDWPIRPNVLSEKDLSWGLLEKRKR